MKNVLVIGGSYFVGRVFVEELRNHADHSIYVMNRGNRPLGLEGVEEIVCDRHDTLTLEHTVPPLEWHALVDFCAYEPRDVDMLLYSLPGSLQHYIFISTTSIYQDSIDIPMKEDAPPLTGRRPGPHGEYGYNKWLTELKLREICEQKGIAHTSLRPSFIYGKYNYAPRESYFFKLIDENKTIIVPALPQGLFTAASVWDIANVCIACLGNEKVFNNAYNVCSDELISYDRLIQVLETIISRKLYAERMSIDKIEAYQIPLPFPLDQHLVYSGALLQQTLNYEYMPFLEGMRKTYAHYLESKS